MDPFHHLNTSFSNPYHPLLSPSPPHHHHNFPPLPPLAAAADQPKPPPSLPPSSSSSQQLDRERLPQWSHAETAAFLAIRADLDHAFLTTKRNKALWEAVSARLAARGFARTPDQCKSKWKNLVTRFKGTAAATEADYRPSSAAAASTTAAAATTRQFPFHEEVRRIFDARAERARALLERNKANKGKDIVRPDDPDDDDEAAGGGEEGDYEEDLLEAEMMAGELELEPGSATTAADERRRAGTAAAARKRRRESKAPRTGSADQQQQGELQVEAMLREFMRRQAEMEERWMEAAEAREAQRRAREAEWRAAMVALGEERLALVRRWRDREDAWRARAEEREERRHQLVAALLAKLGGGGDDASLVTHHHDRRQS